jgi:hypothetical protein
MIRNDFNVKHKSSQLKGSGSKTCASGGKRVLIKRSIEQNYNQ